MFASLHIYSFPNFITGLFIRRQDDTRSCHCQLGMIFQLLFWHEFNFSSFEYRLFFWEILYISKVILIVSLAIEKSNPTLTGMWFFWFLSEFWFLEFCLGKFISEIQVKRDYFVSIQQSIDQQNCLQILPGMFDQETWCNLFSK